MQTELQLEFAYKRCECMRACARQEKRAKCETTHPLLIERVALLLDRLVAVHRILIRQMLHTRRVRREFRVRRSQRGGRGHVVRGGSDRADAVLGESARGKGVWVSGWVGGRRTQSDGKVKEIMNLRFKKGSNE